MELRVPASVFNSVINMCTFALVYESFIGSVGGLSPERRKANIWAGAGLS